MRLQDIMSTDLETIRPEDSAVFANELMWRKQIQHLIVMNGQSIVGIVSDTDLGGPQASDIPDTLRVKDVMSDNVVVAKVNDTIERAQNIMRSRGINCLPLIDETGKLRGIVTDTDLFTLQKRGTAHPPFHGGKV